LPCLAGTGAGIWLVYYLICINLYHDRFACGRAGRVAGTDAEAICAILGWGAGVKAIKLKVDARGVYPTAIYD
jgi:hypothetical protein